MRSQYVPTLFDRFFTEPVPYAMPVRQATFRPPVDLLDRGDAFEVLLDVPGVGQDGFDLRFEDGVLEVRGDRAAPVPEMAPASEDTDAATAGPAPRVLRRERSTGAFQRRIAFRDEIDVDGISATLADGVLRILVPKAARLQPRQIPVTLH